MELDPKAVAERIDYVLRYGGRCRECADNFGVCPASGLPCTVDDAKRAIRHVLEAIAYGKKHGYLTASRSGETGWQPIETAPLNKTVDLWCIEQDSPATWGSGRPAGQIVRGRHKSEKYGWFGNQGNDGVPRHDGPDLVPVAWIEPTPDIPLAMVEQFLAAAPIPTQEPKPGDGYGG